MTETLQRKCEVEAESEQQALETLEKKYRDSEIVLDYQDLVDTEFSNCSYSKKEKLIMGQIAAFCERECGENGCCPEGTCVLYRIQKIIEDGFYED